MAYVALYRQWRPQDFDNLVGQDHIRVTLENALTSGKIAHAYLFTGPRGTGKTSTAKILAKALNCVDGPTAHPCGHCPNCEKITAGISMDVLEVDAASNRGIDEIRDLRETVKFAPVDGRYKVYIIDEVHMLTTEAFNALLKTLEEPPGHVVFILATTEPHKIPATIHSRCQRYDFRRISQTEIESRLLAVAKGSDLQVELDAIKLVAAHADGGMRDALSILDQCAAIGGEQVTADDVRGVLGLIGHDWVWKLTDAVATRDSNESLLILDELVRLGRDVRQILTELVQHARSLLLHLAAPNASIESYTGDVEILRKQSKLFDYSRLCAWIATLHEAINETKWSSDPRITAEMALLTACRDSGGDVGALLERIERLEQALSSHTISLERSERPIHETVVNRVDVNRAEVTGKSVPVSSPMPARTVESAKTTASAPAAAGQVKAIWENALKELVAGGKRMVHACVSQGQLVSLQDNVAVIRFAGSLLKERTEKEDYRAIIENALLQAAGHPVRIQCVLGDEKPETAKPDVAKNEQNEEPPPVVKQAHEIFGGKVIKMDN